jgi:hypothetical protein
MILALLVALSTCLWVIPQGVSAQQASVSFQLFYDELSPYGTWVDYPSYGYVWIPNGGPGFSPYVTDGHWVFTDDGWAWVSDYPWGWAAFHYGRWDYDNVYGWLWVPDEEWGPAWVSWRRSPGYYGWAPLGPGISISIAFGRDYHERSERWVFVRDRDITRPDVNRYYINRTENVAIIRNSTVIANTRRDDKRNATYIVGPGRNDVETVTRTPVQSVAIREYDRPGHHLSNSELQIYRPQVQKRSNSGQSPAPSKVMKLNDVRPVSERNVGNQPRDVKPIDNARKEQQPVPRVVKPSDTRGKEKQPQNVTPSNKSVEPKINRPQVQKRGATGQNPAPSKAIKPNDVRTAPVRNAGNQQREVNPAKNAPKNKQAESRNVKPSNSRGKEKQPQSVTPSKVKAKSKPAQPKSNQPKQDKEGQEKK